MTESSTILNIHTDFTGETKLKGSFYAFFTCSTSFRL